MSPAPFCHLKDKGDDAILSIVSIYSKTFVINAMPLTVMDRNMHGKASIGQSFVARRAPVLTRLHMSIPQVTLHVILSLNCLATEDTSKS